ncbi:MAG: hypothetical protein BHV62_01550 [Eggerthella sp. 51_9]|nr:MAG: hypothetical protein BHV62_01550 [Eggerthella sp. 51_9]
MMTGEEKRPGAIEGLVGGCWALAGRIDLCGMEGDDGLLADRLRLGPSEPPSGEYVHGCATVPAQWAIHALSGKKAER